MFDYSKLCGRIVEKFGTQRQFASELNLSEHSVSQKLQNKVNWKQSEIVRACELLDIEDQDIPVYFFTLNIQSIEH